MVWGFAREAHRSSYGMGIPEYDAKRYEGKVKSGNILLSIHTENSDERERDKEILVKGGAEDISYTEESSVRRTQGGGSKGINVISTAWRWG
jgi:hypothetical protein